MLEKKEGLILVSKLRAILLMEADFNFANKTLYGRRMMYFAEDHGDIPLEAFGSRKVHEAIDVALNRRLIGDILRQQRIAGAIASVDLSNCYDRIVHSILAIGAARWGVPLRVSTYMLTTIQLMVFHL